MQKKNSLDKDTITKIVKGAMIAGGAVAVIYALEAVSSLDFGNYTALVVGICSVIINAVREFIKGERSE